MDFVIIYFYFLNITDNRPFVSYTFIHQKFRYRLNVLLKKKKKFQAYISNPIPKKIPNYVINYNIKLN